MKAFIQLQEMLDRRALLRLDAVIEIDVHGSEPFIGRPLAGELHNGDLEPEPSLVKIENLLHLQRPRKKAATGNQREQAFRDKPVHRLTRSEEHTSELQSLMRISSAVFCFKQK